MYPGRTIVRLTPLKKRVILLNVRVPTVTFNSTVPELLNWSALYQNDYGGRSVDGELKGRKRIEKSSPRDELLDNLDQE